MGKKVLSLVFVLVLMLSLMPVQALAQTEETAGAAENSPQRTAGMINLTEAESAPYWQNPLYGEVPLPAREETPSVQTALRSEPTFESPEEATKTLQGKMIARNNEIFIYTYVANNTSMAQDELENYLYFLWESVLFSAMEHDFWEPAGGDYLSGHLHDVKGDIAYDNTSSTSTMYIQLCYDVTYTSTKEQEAAVEEKIDSILESMALQDKTAYEATKAIYDYIAQNVVHDDAATTSDIQAYTAYGALIEGSAAYGGYAMLFYRMALQATNYGIYLDTRVIPGTIEGVAHAWNIVCVDHYFYNVDVTWDAERAQAGADYAYFLKNEVSFSDHVRADGYLTGSFNASYPMATWNFPEDSIACSKCGDDLLWRLTEDGTLFIYGTGNMYTRGSNTSMKMWGSYRSAVKKLVVEEGVTSLGREAFANHYSLETVILPSTLRTIDTQAFMSNTSLKEVVLPAGLEILDSAFYGCTALTQITFTGDAPEIDAYCFKKVTATVFYPAGNETWTEEVRQNYGGTLTWVAVCMDGHDYTSVVTAPTCTEDGYTTHTCQSCGDSYTDTPVPATGHNMSDWIQEGPVEVSCCQNEGCDCCVYKSGAKNEATGTLYASVAEALNAAKEGETVTLIADNDESGKTLIIRPGVTLNLGSHTLRADFLIGLTGSMLNADRYSNKEGAAYGKLVVPMNNLAMTGSVAVENGKNDVIPVWNGVDAYVLANAHINDYDAGYGLVIDEENKKIDFAFTHVMGGSANSDFLKNGADDNALKIVIRLSWQNENGIAYQDFVYNADFVGTVAGGGYNYTFSLTGYDALNIDVNNLTVTAMILTDCGIVSSGTVWSGNDSAA